MKQFVGTVVSTKMKGTVLVNVTSRSTHPVYKKVVKKDKKFAADTNNIEVKEGEMVMIQETRPMSKTKKFKVMEIVKKA